MKRVVTVFSSLLIVGPLLIGTLGLGCAPAVSTNTGGKTNGEGKKKDDDSKKGDGDGKKSGEETKKIDMPVIKLKDLVAHIAAQKGKVVIVDLWGFFCVPCKEEFPNLFRLHHTYGDKGLVCISLSMDFNDDLRSKAIGFLKEKKAEFTNYWLEEGIEGAQKQWNFEPIPVVVVYGRDGKLAKVFNNDDPNKEPFSYKKDVEPLVKKLIEAK